MRFMDENEDATGGKENRAISELVGAEVHSGKRLLKTKQKSK